MKKITSLFILTILCSPLLFSQSVATYDIVFESIWDSTTNDPTNGCSTIDLPGGAHWSSLVGATHATANTFLEMGQAATPGIESVAETGAYGTFQTEVTSNADADQFINGGGLGSGKGTISISDLQVSENYPLLTLASMIAPSPDWFIAINSYDLRNGGSWVNSVTIDLFPYDAGTEDGTGYSLSNPATTPQGVITSRSNTTPFNEKKIGTITITLKSVLNTIDSRLGQLSFYPNPARDHIIISNSKNIQLRTIEIYNAIGKRSKIFPVRNNVSDFQLDISSLNSGIYLLKINAINDESLTKKLIIK
ncbi:spondin domain-containing protein [Seonamhaeicola sp.]|uniref:T9SS type A sorting domain-containing protein n=1 Tax=Seonamhaeicola sp. TaxID=1912245 RepID=UPI002621A50B|nr:spondin domain-containing protein [Seonamhaeicola sp.]